MNWIVLIALVITVLLAWSRLLSMAAVKRELAELRLSEQRYRMLFDQSPKPMYAFDIEKLSFLDVNEAALRHYGYSRPEFLSLTADRIRPSEEMALMLNRTANGIQTPCMTRHLKKDGTLIDVEVSVQHLRNGSRTLALVSVNDVTDQKRAEENLKSAHERLAQSVSELQQREMDLRQLARVAEMLQSCHTSDEAYSIVSELSPQLFLDFSGSLYILTASRNMVEVVASWGSYQVFASLFVPDDCWGLRRARTHLSQAGNGPRCKHAPAERSVGLCIPLMAHGGDAIGLLHLIPNFIGAPETSGIIPTSLENLAKAAADQIALALSNIRYREALQNQSIRDPLTTLFNRRYMEESLERELHRARREHGWVGIVMFDVDHFKDFNDCYGHRTADKMLSLLGRYMQSAVRCEDIVCRYGGEEFVLILPGCDGDESLKHARQLQKGIRRLRLETAADPVGKLTISAGIAVFPQHGADAETLLAVADRSLYDAKEAGRDRVILAQQPASVT
jgi:diguanylate cyclase (GGDEF)-like protein/PAS domain S-box-containing protein